MAGNSNSLTGILLAGGNSSRMGREKGGIEVRGRTLFRTALGTLEKSCDKVMISTCSKLPGLERYRQVCDEIRGIGPMGGLYSCLRQSDSELNLVFSNDMPMVTPDLLKALVKEADGADLVIPSLGDRPPEPLCALYRKGVAERLHELIVGGTYAVHELFPLVRTKFLRIGPEMPFYHPDLFLNVNRPADLQRYRSILDNHG